MNANWKTSLWGSIQAVAMGIVTGAIVFPSNWHDPKQDILFFAVVILTGSGLKFAFNAKDRNVTGGSVAQTLSGNVARQGTQTLVDETMKTTVASGEAITPQQRQALNSLPLTKLLAFAAILSCVLPVGCANQTVGGDTAANVRHFVADVEPSLRPLSSMACSLVLSFATSPNDQQDVKNDLFVVAGIVAAITPDTSPSDLSRAIQAALPKTQQYRTLADSIAGAWAIALPYAKGDTSLGIKTVADIAAGITDVAGLPTPALQSTVNQGP